MGDVLLFKRPAIIVDLDDCLFDSRHLDQYIPKKSGDRAGWNLVQEKMAECEVNKHILAILDMAFIKDIELIFVTGREGTEALKTVTENELDLYFPRYHIFYRPENDYRKAAVVKKEIYENHIKGKYDILFAIDDDETNIKMFQELGLNTLHCRYGKVNNG